MSEQKKFLEENELAYKRLDKLYDCRNLEINNLWQRSAFLIGILLLIFTGYGVLLFNKLEDFNLDSEYINISANVMGLLISILGFAFSQLWIKIGKGSKAWYEVYETAISQLERTLANKYEKKETDEYKPSWYYMGAMNTEVDNRLFHTNAGAYSPSKINIILGQYSLIIWIISMVIHSLLCVIFCIKNFAAVFVTVVVTVVITVVIAVKIYKCRKKEKEKEKLSLAKKIKDIIDQEDKEDKEDKKIEIDNFKDFHDILTDEFQSIIKETIKKEDDNDINFYFMAHRYETRKELEFYVKTN